MDPFLCEARAYERIRRVCPPQYTHLFRSYFGVKYYEEGVRCVVTELLPRVPPILYVEPPAKPGLIDDTTQELLHAFHLTAIEHQWYQQLLEARLLKCSILHEMDIAHRDCSNDNFRLSSTNFDGPLSDFSMSCTFSNMRQMANMVYCPIDRVAAKKEDILSIKQGVMNM